MRRIRLALALPLLAACASVSLPACSSDPAPAAPDLATQLAQDTGTPWTVYTDPRSHEVRFLAPEKPVAIGAGTPEEKARAFFTRYGAALHTSGKSDEIRLVGSVSDSRGGIHIRFAHFLPGTDVPVFGSGTTAHFTADGAVYWLQTDFRADLADVDGQAAVTRDEAANTALAYVTATCGPPAGGAAPSIAGAAELGVLSDPDTHAALAYRVRVTTQSEHCVAPSVFVDAKSGAALKIEESAHSVQDPTVGGSRFFRLKDFRDVKPISITTVPGNASKFQMISDDESSARVITRDFNTNGVIQTNDIAHWDESSRFKGAAVDAHFHTREALKFLRPFANGFAAHDRAFVFPLARDLNVFVHDDSALNSGGFNAFAWFDEGTKQDTIHFGDGTSPTITNALPFSAAYDVVAHELTHLVTAHTSNLKYERESGALNESFSDVMGSAAERALFPDEKKNFLIGEDLFIDGLPGLTALRSMTSPRDFGDPDHRDRLIPCPASGPTVANDQCGVHGNSGIPNRAFSLIVAGGSVRTAPNDGSAGVVRPVGVPTGIGWDAATELTYWATTGLNATATFENAALAQIAEAGRVGGPGAGFTVLCAWHAVGVLTGSDDAEAILGATFCQPPPEAAPPPPPPPPPPPGANVCSGHGSSSVCDPAKPNQAIVCKNGVPDPASPAKLCADSAQLCKSVSADDPTAVLDADGVIVCE